METSEIILISIITFVVLLFYIGFNQHLKLKDKEKQEESDLEQQRLEKIITVIAPNITKKLTKGSFSTLNGVERNILFELAEQMATNPKLMHENEVKALEVAYADQATFNMIQMRNNQLSRLDQANALQNLKHIKFASSISALHAAREIGEDFSEG